MKSRIITVFTAFVLAYLPLSVHAQDPAMYIYRNDGTVNGFLMSQVDSMSYSCLGLDSVEYSMPVVQEVWLKSGIYRVPISEIDSIGYYSPEPIFKPGLFIIDEENVGQVAKVDFNPLTISFKVDTPENELPVFDQVIFCELEEEPFPMGFSGRVKGIKTEGGLHVYECVVAGPEEVYDRLLMVGHIDSNGYEDNLAPKRRSPRKAHHDTSFNISTKLFDMLTISGKGTLSLDYTIEVNAFNPDPVTVWLKKECDIDVEFKVGFSDEDMHDGLPNDVGEWEKNTWAHPFTLFTIAKVLNVDLRCGCYCSIGNKISIEASGLKYQYKQAEEYYWRHDNPFYIERNELFNEGGWNFDPLEDNITDIIKLKAELEGSVSFGFCLEFDLDIWKPDWLALALELKGGPELKGSMAVDTDLLKTDNVETMLYKYLSEDLKLTLGLKLGLDLKARYGDKEWKILKTSTTLFPKTVTFLPKLTKPALPKIYEVSPNKYMLDTYGDWDSNLGWDSNDPMAVSTTAKNQPLFPGAVGLFIYGENGDQLGEYFSDPGEDWTWNWQYSFAQSIRGISPQKIKVFPVYKLFGLWPVKAASSTINIPKPLSLSTHSAITKVGESINVTCNDGWGYYSWESSNEKVATLQIKDVDGVKKIQATGVRPGKTSVNIKDVRSGDIESFDLTVKSGAFSLSSYEIRMNPEDIRTVTIFPQGDYKLKNSNSNIATAQIIESYNEKRNSNVIQIKALKVGKCTITVSGNPDEPSLSINVEVTNDYIQPGILSIEPSSITFKNVPAGNTRREDFAVTNTGEKSIRLRIKEGSELFSFSDYSVITLDPDEYKYLSVEFTPPEANKDYAYDAIIMTDAENGNQRLKITGNSVEPSLAHIEIDPSTLDFDEVEINTIKSKNFTVRNSGESAMTISISELYSDVFAFKGSGGEYIIFPGKELTFEVFFSPVHIGEQHECVVTISSDAENGNQTLTLKGKGKEYENYVHGVCSGFSPEDGAIVDASSGYVRLECEEFIYTHDGVNIIEIRLNETPSFQRGRVRSWNCTWNGSKGGSHWGSDYYDFKINPNTKYYWQVFFFDFEEGGNDFNQNGEWRECSPIMTFTTGSE